MAQAGGKMRVCVQIRGGGHHFSKKIGRGGGSLIRVRGVHKGDYFVLTRIGTCILKKTGHIIQDSHTCHTILQKLLNSLLHGVNA